MVCRRGKTTHLNEHNGLADMKQVAQSCLVTLQVFIVDMIASGGIRYINKGVKMAKRVDSLLKIKVFCIQAAWAEVWAGRWKSRAPT